MRNTASGVIRAREAERARLARLVHDDLAQVLAALRLEVGIASMTGSPEQELGQALDRISGLVDRATRAAQDLLADLRPPVLDDLGLIPALRDHVAVVRRRSGLDIVLSVEGSCLRGDETAEEAIAIYRVLQEALSNVERHAEATHVHVVLGVNDGELRLDVRDDGCGFDPGRLRGRARGLGDMRTRAAAANGRLSLRSAPDAGTRVVLRIPRPPAAVEPHRRPS